MSFDSKKTWTDIEDLALITVVDDIGTKNWTLVSIELKRSGNYHRTGKQCRERWYNHLDPKIVKVPWTNEEDDMVFELYKKLGRTWSKISEFLPGRSDNSVKNRFNPKYSQRQRDNRFPFIPSTNPRLPKTTPNPRSKTNKNTDSFSPCSINRKMQFILSPTPSSSYQWRFKSWRRKTSNATILSSMQNSVFIPTEHLLSNLSIINSLTLKHFHYFSTNTTIFNSFNYFLSFTWIILCPSPATHDFISFSFGPYNDLFQ